MIDYGIKEKKLLKYTLSNTLATLSINLVIPLLSIILLANNWTTLEISLFFTTAILARFLLSPVLGKISDAYGSKRVLLVSVLFQGLAFLIYFFIIEYKSYAFILRFLEGLVYANYSILSLKFFEELVSKKKGFWLGIFFGVSYIGVLIGPIIGGFFIEFMSPNFLFIFGFLSFLVCFLSFYFNNFDSDIKKIKKVKFSIRDFNPFSEFSEFLSYRRLRGAAIIGITANSLHQLLIVYFPIYVVQILGYPAYYVGIFLGFSSFLHLFQFLYGRIGDAVSPGAGSLLGILFSSSAMILLPITTTEIGIILIMLLYGLGLSIFNVNCWLFLDKVAEKNNIEGEINGTYISFASLGVLITISLSSFITSAIGIVETFQLFGLILFISIFIAYFFMSPIFFNKRNKLKEFLVKREKN